MLGSHNGKPLLSDYCRKKISKLDTIFLIGLLYILSSRALILSFMVHMFFVFVLGNVDVEIYYTFKIATTTKKEAYS
jgi:hypothetical protein